MSFNKRSNYYNKEYIKKNPINKEIISGLFSIIASGDINKIQKYISSNDIRIDSTDENKNSVIHFLLDLSDTQVSEENKLINMKYFITSGVSHDSINKYNQTPLHIASKKQYTKIIDYLVKKLNSNTIVKNSFKMTPLHLAAQGHIIECKKEKKIEPLISLPDYKEKKFEISEFSKLITSFITDELRNEQNIDKDFFHKRFNLFLKHAKNVINVTHLNQNISEQLMDLKDKKQEILMNSLASDDEKKSMYEQLIADKSDIIYDKLKDFHKKGIKPINFKPIDVKYDDDYIKVKEGFFSLVNHEDKIMGDFNSLSEKPNPNTELSKMFNENCSNLSILGNDIADKYKDTVNQLVDIKHNYDEVYNTINKIRLLTFNAHLKNNDDTINIKNLNYLSSLKDNSKNMRNNFSALENKLTDISSEFLKNFNNQLKFDSTDNEINKIIEPLKKNMQNISIENKNYVLYDDVVNSNRVWTVNAGNNPVNNDGSICLDPINYGADGPLPGPPIPNPDAAIVIAGGVAAFAANIYQGNLRAPSYTNGVPTVINNRSLNTNNNIFPEIITEAITEYFILIKNSKNDTVTEDQRNNIIKKTFENAKDLLKKGIIEIRADIAVRTPNQNNLLDDITDSINNFQTLSGHCQTIIATYLNRRNNNNYQYQVTPIINNINEGAGGNDLQVFINGVLGEKNDFLQVFNHAGVNPTHPNDLFLTKGDLISRRIRFSTSDNLNINIEILSTVSAIIEIIHTYILERIINNNVWNAQDTVNNIYTPPAGVDQVLRRVIDLIDRPRMLLQGNDAGLYGVQTINYYEAELVNRINNDLSNGLLDNNSKQLYYTQIDKKTREDVNNFLNLTTRYPYALKNVCNILNIIRYSNLDFNFTGIDDIVAGRVALAAEYFNQNDLPIINLTDLFYDVNKFSSVNKGKNTLIKYFGLVSGLSLHLYENYKYLYDNPGGPTTDAEYPLNAPFIPAGAARNYDDFIYRIGIHRYDQGMRAINYDKYMINNIRILAILHQTRPNVIGVGGLNTIFSQLLIFPSNNGVLAANWNDLAGINNIDKVYKLLVRSSLVNNVIILDNLKNNSNNFQGFDFVNKDYDNLETFSNLEDINDKDVSKALTIALLSLYSGINYIRKVKSLVLPVPPAGAPIDANIQRIYNYLDNDIDNTIITRIYDEINSQIFNNNNQLLSQEVLDEIINEMKNYKQTIANENSEIINEKLSIYATLCLCFKSLEMQIPNAPYVPIGQVVNILYNPVVVGGAGIDFFNIPSQIRPISNVASKICDNLKSFKSIIDPSVQTTERQGNQNLNEESELDKIYALISKNDGKYSNIKNNLETNSSYHNLQLVVKDNEILIKQYLSNPIDINKISDDEPSFKQQLKIIDNVRKQLNQFNIILPDLKINDDDNKENFEKYFNELSKKNQEILNYLSDSYSTYEGFYLEKISENNKLDNRINNDKYGNLNKIDNIIKHPKSISSLCDKTDNQKIYFISNNIKSTLDSILVAKVLKNLHIAINPLVGGVRQNKTKSEILSIVNKTIFEPLPVQSDYQTIPQYNIANPFNDIFNDFYNIYKDVNQNDGDMYNRLTTWNNVFQNIINELNSFACSINIPVNDLNINLPLGGLPNPSYINFIDIAAYKIYNQLKGQLNIIFPAGFTLVNVARPINALWNNSFPSYQPGDPPIPVVNNNNDNFLLNFVLSVYNQVLYDTRYYYNFENILINLNNPVDKKQIYENICNIYLDKLKIKCSWFDNLFIRSNTKIDIMNTIIENLTSSVIGANIVKSIIESDLNNIDDNNNDIYEKIKNSINMDDYYFPQKLINLKNLFNNNEIRDVGALPNTQIIESFNEIVPLVPDELNNVHVPPLATYPNMGGMVVAPPAPVRYNPINFNNFDLDEINAVQSILITLYTGVNIDNAILSVFNCLRNNLKIHNFIDYQDRINYSYGAVLTPAGAPNVIINNFKNIIRNINKKLYIISKLLSLCILDYEEILKPDNFSEIIITSYLLLFIDLNRPTGKVVFANLRGVIAMNDPRINRTQDEVKTLIPLFQNYVGLIDQYKHSTYFLNFNLNLFPALPAPLPRDSISIFQDLRSDLYEGILKFIENDKWTDVHRDTLREPIDILNRYFIKKADPSLSKSKKMKIELDKQLKNFEALKNPLFFEVFNNLFVDNENDSLFLASSILNVIYNKFNIKDLIFDRININADYNNGYISFFNITNNKDLTNKLLGNIGYELFGLKTKYDRSIYIDEKEQLVRLRNQYQLKINDLQNNRRNINMTYNATARTYIIDGTLGLEFSKKNSKITKIDEDLDKFNQIILILNKITNTNPVPAVAPVRFNYINFREIKRMSRKILAIFMSKKDNLFGSYSAKNTYYNKDLYDNKIYENDHMILINKIYEKLKFWNGTDFDYLKYENLHTGYGHIDGYDFFIDNKEKKSEEESDEDEENKDNHLLSFMPKLDDENESRYANYTVKSIDDFEKGKIQLYFKDTLIEFFNNKFKNIWDNNINIPLIGNINTNNILTNIQTLFQDIFKTKLFENLINENENNNIFDENTIKPFILPKIEQAKKPWIINKNDTYESLVNNNYKKNYKQKGGMLDTNVNITRPGETTNINLVENAEDSIPLSMVDSSLSDSLNHNIIDANIFSIIYRLCNYTLGLNSDLLHNDNIDDDDIEAIKIFIKNLCSNNYKNFNLLYSKHIISLLNKINKKFIRFLKVYDNEKKLINDKVENLKKLINNIKYSNSNINNFQTTIEVLEEKLTSLLDKQIDKNLINIKDNVKEMIEYIQNLIIRLNKTNQISIVKQLFYKYSKFTIAGMGLVSEKVYKDVILLNNIYDKPLPQLNIVNIQEKLDNIGNIDLRNLEFRVLTIPQITKGIFFYSYDEDEASNNTERKIDRTNLYGLTKIQTESYSEIPGIKDLLDMGRKVIELKDLFLEDIKHQYVNINNNNIESSELGENFIPIIRNIENQTKYIKGILKKPPKSTKKISIIPFDYPSFVSGRDISIIKKYNNYYKFNLRKDQPSFLLDSLEKSILLRTNIVNDGFLNNYLYLIKYHIIEEFTQHLFLKSIRRSTDVKTVPNLQDTSRKIENNELKGTGLKMRAPNKDTVEFIKANINKKNLIFDYSELLKPIATFSDIEEEDEKNVEYKKKIIQRRYDEIINSTTIFVEDISGLLNNNTMIPTIISIIANFTDKIISQYYDHALKLEASNILREFILDKQVNDTNNFFDDYELNELPIIKPDKHFRLNLKEISKNMKYFIKENFGKRSYLNKIMDKIYFDEKEGNFKKYVKSYIKSILNKYYNNDIFKDKFEDNEKFINHFKKYISRNVDISEYKDSNIIIIKEYIEEELKNKNTEENKKIKKNNYKFLKNDNNLLRDPDKVHYDVNWDKPPNKKNPHITYSTNYYSDENDNILKCYEIDYKNINSLIYGINDRDIYGQTPIYYAINLMHPGLTKMLINNKAELINIKNNKGLSPIQFALIQYNNHTSNFSNKNIKDSIFNITNQYNKDIIETLNNNVAFNNNIISFLDIAIPQFIIMYNNLFYNKCKYFVNNWNIKDNEILNLNNYGIKPLENILKNKNDLKDIINNNSNFNVLEEANESTKKEIKKIKKLYNKIFNQIKNLKKQKDYFENNEDQIYKNNIEEKINSLTSELNILKENINFKDSYLNNFKNNVDDILYSQIDEMIQKLDNIETDDLIEYNNLIKLILSGGIKKIDLDMNINENNTLVDKQSRSYEFLYKKYISSNYVNNNQVIHLNILNMEEKLSYELIESLNNNKIDEHKQKLKTIQKFYDNILHNTIFKKNIKRRYLDENKKLKEVFDIIVHIVENIVGKNFLAAIRKLLFNNFANNIGESTKYSKSINDTIDKILGISSVNNTNSSKEKSIEGYIIGYEDYKLVEEKEIFNIYETFFNKLKSYINKMEKVVIAGDKFKNSLIGIIKFISTNVNNMNTYRQKMTDGEEFDNDYLKIFNLANELDVIKNIEDISLENKFIAVRDQIFAFYDIYKSYYYKEKSKKFLYTKHIPGKLSINIVKYLTNIKKNENDFYDSNINSIEDLFNIIIEKILSNNSYNLERQDIIIDYLQTKIIPFYMETYSIIIKNINKSMLNYDRFIQNQRAYIHIVNNLLDAI
jgi:hypothetical protein